MEENYLANFVQSVFDALADTGTPVKGGTLVVSGDGRSGSAGSAINSAFGCAQIPRLYVAPNWRTTAI